MTELRGGEFGAMQNKLFMQRELLRGARKRDRSAGSLEFRSAQYDPRNGVYVVSVQGGGSVLARNNGTAELSTSAIVSKPRHFPAANTNTPNS